MNPKFNASEKLRLSAWKRKPCTQHQFVRCANVVAFLGYRMCDASITCGTSNNKPVLVATNMQTLFFYMTFSDLQIIDETNPAANLCSLIARPWLVFITVTLIMRSVFICDVHLFSKIMGLRHRWPIDLSIVHNMRNFSLQMLLYKIEYGNLQEISKSHLLNSC